VIGLVAAALLPVVVLDGGTARPPSALTKKPALALAAWAATHQESPVALPPDAPPPTGWVLDATARATRVGHVEGALRRARTLLDDGDPTKAMAARGFATEAYAEARAHPEDPECPTWLAEALRALARAEALGGDATGAAGLLHRARLLDGGRLLGLSESPALVALPTGPVRTLRVTVAGKSKTRVYVDGALATGPVSVETGEHHLRVVIAREGELDGPLLDARLFSVGDTDATIELHDPVEVVPCSGADLADALGALAKDPKAVFVARCPGWARVVPREDGSIAVQRCGPTGCAKPTVWLAPEVSPKPIPLPPSTSVLRSPWTWVAIGAGVVVAGSLTAWKLGAFDRKEAPAPTWRWEPTR